MFLKVSKVNLAAMLASLTIFAFASNLAMANSSGDGVENVVISLNTDPTKDPEPACVALQIGMNLLMSDLNNDEIDDVVPADDVTLFLTTGGVELVNPHNSIYNRTKPKPVCTTPAGDKTASLQALLQGFKMRGGNIMICPLCANSRGITDPTAGEPGTAVDIHNLFLYADKVLTF